MIHRGCGEKLTKVTPSGGRTSEMKRNDARINKTVKLVQALDEALSTLESALHLQFDTKASLLDKLTASKEARSALRKCRRYQKLIAELLEFEE